jgi:hypothetical protein
MHHVCIKPIEWDFCINKRLLWNASKREFAANSERIYTNFKAQQRFPFYLFI